MLQAGFCLQSLSDDCGKSSKSKTDASPAHSSNIFPSPAPLSTKICLSRQPWIPLAMRAPQTSGGFPKQLRRVEPFRKQTVISSVLDEASVSVHQPMLQVRARPENPPFCFESGRAKKNRNLPPKTGSLHIRPEFCVKATLGACNQQERRV